MSRAIQIESLLTPVIDYRDGAVASGYTVYFYAAGTTTPKNVWTEKEKTSAYTTRTLGGDGTVQVYGDGIYKIIIKDVDGTTVYEWDNVKVQANTFTVQSKSNTYTATEDDDLVLVDTTAGDVTVYLDDVRDFTHPITIKVVAGTNNAVVTPTVSQTVDGNATDTLSPIEPFGEYFPDTTAEIWRKGGISTLEGLTASVSELNQLTSVTVGGTTGGDIATIDGTQTLTNKTLTSPKLNEDVALSATSTTLNKVITTDDAQTLTNKTLTSPKINEDVALTATATTLNKVATTDDTQTLTNKTLTSPKVNEDVALTATATKLNDLAGTTATGAEITAAADGIGVTIPRQIVIEIGDWDMDATSGISVAHGMSVSKIVGVRGIIRYDGDTVRYPFGQYDAAGGSLDICIEYVDSVNIRLERKAASIFDDVAFDSTSYNRGWIIIDYVD